MKLPAHYALLCNTLEKGVVVAQDSALDKKKEQISDILKAFKVRAEVIGVTQGPSITRFEVRPRMGVSLKSITKLADDIQCAMSAKSVRMEAPVAGENFVGIEIPNATPETVVLRDLVETTEFAAAESLLSFPLGKAINGTPIFADLAKMPHLLIAGSTNSGKSVLLNALITSILMRATPEEVEFILIDPKRVELSLFNGIPHMKGKAITNPDDAVTALYNAVLCMNSRYELFEKSGVRNIQSYNEKAKEKLPYKVIVVDELADLMMTATYEVETYLTRLAQLSRAVGIHLVIATQRPSVNVITGTIKANFPSRIAFSLPSAVDSRTILAASGAEDLLGRGDMLAILNDGNGTQRVQGAYLTEKEVGRVVETLR